MRLPLLSGRKVIKAFGKAGYRVVRQRGSHVILHKAGVGMLCVPLHAQLDRGTLKAILREARMDVNDFVRWLA
jgi:predicted RNA binding protein YcfA (HicA-like mRNA interferase family)